MRCFSCGRELEETDLFCPNCGKPTQKGSEPASPSTNEVNNAPKNESNNTPNNNKGGNSGVVKACIITVLIVAILAAVGFAVYSMFLVKDDDDDDDDDDNKTNTTVVSNETPGNSTDYTNLTPATPPTSDNTTPVTPPVQNTSTYKVSFGGFTLYIPDNLVYQVDSGKEYISIGDSLSTWIAQASIQEGSYAKMKQNMNRLKPTFEQSYGVTVSNVEAVTIDGVEFIIVEASQSGSNALIAYTELNSMNIMCITIETENNDFNRDILNNLVYTVKTAEYVGKEEHIEIKSKIKLKDAKEAAKKIVKEKK